MKELKNVTIRGKTSNIKIDYNPNTDILSLYANTTYDPYIYKEEVYIEYGTGIILDFNEKGVGQLFQISTIMDMDLTLPTYLLYANSKLKNKELVICFKLSSAGYETFKSNGLDTCSIYKKGDKIAEILLNN